MQQKCSRDDCRWLKRIRLLLGLLSTELHYESILCLTLSALKYIYFCVYMCVCVLEPSSLCAAWQLSNCSALLLLLVISVNCAAAILRYIVCVFRFGSKNKQNTTTGNASWNAPPPKQCRPPIRQRPVLLMISLVL